MPSVRALAREDPEHKTTAAVVAVAAQGVYAMTKPRNVTRRNAMQLGAAAATLPLVHIRTAGAAGKLTVGFWDHWVPPANDAMKKQVGIWAEKNKVEVTIDFITSNGGKIAITQAAEAQARTGHDFLPFYNWDVNTYADKLEPMDDVVKAMTAQYRSVQPNSRIPVEAQGTLDGAAIQHRHAELKLLRPDQPTEAARWG